MMGELVEGDSAAFLAMNRNRCERLGDVGAEHEVGEPELLTAALELLSGGRGIVGEHGRGSPPRAARRGRCRRRTP